MVAYSFQAQFVDPILSGRKRQTVRAVGKRRHALVGDELQLYTGMRTRQCRLVGRSTCVDVRPVRLNFAASLECDLVIVRGDDGVWVPRGANEFARADGFPDWRALHSFWDKAHGTAEAFSGLLVCWALLEAFV